MVFNAVAGGDDDHPRNHAALFNAAENRWRLSPAFDVVPNPDDTPATLTLQLSLGRYDISREAMLADALRFGFAGHDAAASYLDALLTRIEHAYGRVEGILGAGLQWLLRKRMRDNVDLLR